MGAFQEIPNGEADQPAKPRFLEARDKLDTILPLKDGTIGQRHYEATNSAMAHEAEQFDIITGRTGVVIEGDATKIKRQAAERLRHAIEAYSGPDEVRQVYGDLYDQELDSILGLPEGRFEVCYDLSISKLAKKAAKDKTVILVEIDGKKVAIQYPKNRDGAVYVNRVKELLSTGSEGVIKIPPGENNGR